MLSEKMVAADKIFFVTPVYWYAMSAPLKTFFDRLSDLVTIRKTVGRALVGKKVWLLVNGGDEIMPEGFEVPFQKTCDYLDMRYQTSLYLHTGENEDLRQSSWSRIKGFQHMIIG